MTSETIVKKEEPKKTREVLYRKYRFSSFADMCGQDQVASFFINTIKYNKISHAYLFAGPRGTGKTSMARLFAKILNCTGKTTYEACNQCPNCVEFDRGTAIDIIEKDAASNRGIDEIRSLCEDASFMPSMGRYKIFILDEAHMLTKEASNAFLKTLEEPPPYVIFILATTELHKISATILSRCQLVNFSRIPVAGILKRLEYVVAQENLSRAGDDKIKIARDALVLIAKKAAGGMRDALSLLEYVIALCAAGGEIKSEVVEKLLGVHSVKAIKKFVDCVVSRNAGEGLDMLKQVHSSGNELLAFLESLNSYLISMVLIKFGSSGGSTLECDEDDLADMKEMADKVDERYLFRLIEIYSECLSTIRNVPDQLVHLEFVFIKSVIAKNEEPRPAAQPKPAEKPVQAAVPDMAAIEALIERKIEAVRLAAAQARAAQPSAASQKPAQPSSPGAAAGAEKSAPASEGGAPRQNVSIDRVKSAWNSTYLSALKQSSIPTHAILSAGVVRGIAGGALEIDFSKNTFCGERMQTGNHLKIAEDVFAEVFGGRMPFKIIAPAATRGSAEQRKQEIIEEKKNDPTLKKILEAFNGEIVDVHE